MIIIRDNECLITNYYDIDLEDLNASWNLSGIDWHGFKIIYLANSFFHLFLYTRATYTLSFNDSP